MTNVSRVSGIQGNTKTKMALLALSLLSLTVSSVLSARIVGFMTLGGSQYINMKHIMEELASRGHQVDKESVVLIFMRHIQVVSLILQRASLIQSLEKMSQILKGVLFC